MAAFKIELEIDSAAHPELHAVLSIVGNDSYRAERFRQLASSGLIWEQMRSAKLPKKDALTLPVLRDEVVLEQHPALASNELPVSAVDKPLLNDTAQDITHDTAPAVHMSGKRSRLMRMKSRGLFTNE
jgi:hypothetical protein